MLYLSNFLILILFISCQSGIQKTEYELIWSDEFNQELNLLILKWF